MSLTPLDSESMRLAGLEAIRKAEKARNRAQRRAEEIEQQALHHLQLCEYAKLSWWGRLWTKPENMRVDQRLVDAVAGVWTSEDGTWSVAVSDNRWYLSQAAAYGANK